MMIVGSLCLIEEPKEPWYNFRQKLECLYQCLVFITSVYPLNECLKLWMGSIVMFEQMQHEVIHLVNIVLNIIIRK